MRRPVILQGNPFISEYYRKNAVNLLSETGGNTGNLAFRFAVVSHLVNPAIIPWDTPANEIRQSGDVVVLPLANQLGSHMNLAREALKLTEIGLPVVGLGLGAQAATMDEDVVLNEGTLSWLGALASHAASEQPNIGVRGEYTGGQIAKFGWPNSTSIIGCPSNFINTADDIASAVKAGFKRKLRRVAVAAGIPYITELATLEQNLAELVTVTGGAYIAQHDLEMIRLARGEFDLLEPNLFQVCRNYILPTSSDDEFKAWLRQHAYAFFDVQAWIDFLRRFDFVVGTRFHGVMLAIQAGIPAGCIVHDSRTMEMCQTMGIPFCRFSDIKSKLELDNILDYFKFDSEHFNHVRRHLHKNYLSVLRAAQIEQSTVLMKLTG